MHAEVVVVTVASQLNEIVLEIRKSFGMFGRTNWGVAEVTPDVVTVRIFHWRKDVSVAHTAANVRNAMLNMLGDTIPCSRFLAVFSGPGTEGAEQRVELAFYPPEGADLPSQFIVIEENVKAQRQEWRALVDRAAGSDTYFTQPRKGRTT